MPDRVSVVPVKSDVSEADFATSVLAGLASALVRMKSVKAVAYVLDVSTTMMGAYMRGSSLPTMKRLFDLHQVEGTALNDVADLYGLKIVPKGSICTHDTKPLSVLAVALLSKAIDAELDGVEDHQELLGMEVELRAVGAAVDRRLAQIKELRAPSKVRAVA